MARRTGKTYGLHDDALVFAYRCQVGGFTDHTVASQRLTVFCQQAGAGHRGFFIRGGYDRQRMDELLGIEILAGSYGHGDKAFHVTAAQAVQAIIAFCQLKGVGLPQRLIEWYGIGMAG